MFSLNATLPVFLVIVLGWFLMQKKMFNENFVDIINKFVFKVSLPVLLFKDIATTPSLWWALSPRPPPGAAPPFSALPLSRISMAIPV